MLKLETRNSLCATSPPRKRGSMGLWIPAFAGMTNGGFESRLAGFELPVSNFDFRISIRGFPLSRE